MSQADDWLLRWRTGRIGFHQDTAHRGLVSLWPSLELTAGAAVLVPLCGKSRDVRWLLGQGLHVFAMDISPVAIELLLQEGGLLARRNAGTFHTQYDGERLRALCADFFQLAKLNIGPFQGIYDRAAFGAMAPQWRSAYAKNLESVCESGTRVLLILLEYPGHETAGPPFSISGSEVAHHFGAHFAIRERCREDILQGDPRMAARGVTQLHEVTYLLEHR